MPPGTTVGADLAVRDARVTYSARGRAVDAIAGVSFTIQPGEFVSLIGPSGCGKSTLLRAIAGLHELSQGEITVEGAPPGRLAAGEVGVVFQEPALLPWRTVAGNVRLPLAGGASVRGDAGAAIAAVGLADFADYYPRQLSGGMEQRVAIARALMHNPRLLLMDEPFGSLDELTREDLRVHLIRLWEADRRTVLFVTHSVSEAVLLSDRVLVMTSRPGRITADVAINLPRPRALAMETQPDFQTFVAALRGHLRE
ncbi:MAG: ABC transporter ATP-binding protein [Dehalococcoidia bacterium]